MSWVRFDDRMFGNEKLIECGGNSFKLWAFSVSFANNQQTDGFIKRSVLRVLGGTKRSANELVKLGLWDEVDGGWMIHDYLDFQPSKAQIKASQQATAERVKRLRERRRNGVTNALHQAGCNGQETDQEEEEKEEEGDPPYPPPEDIPIPCPSPVLPPKAVEDIAANLGVSVAAVRAGIQEFVGYWTIGGGANHRFSRAKWMAKAREDLRYKHQAGKLREPESDEAEKQRLAEHHEKLRKAEEAFNRRQKAQLARAVGGNR